MKFSRCVLLGVAVFGMFILLSNSAFAKEKCCAKAGRHEDKVKLLQDSAQALQKTNPALSKSLSDWASSEEKEMQEWKEIKAKHEARIKLLTDSASALEKTNPDLAKGLKEMSERKFSGKKYEMMQEKNEKEEQGEMAEPKEEHNENVK